MKTVKKQRILGSIVAVFLLTTQFMSCGSNDPVNKNNNTTVDDSKEASKRKYEQMILDHVWVSSDNPVSADTLDIYKGSDGQYHNKNVNYGWSNNKKIFSVTRDKAYFDTSWLDMGILWVCVDIYVQGSFINTPDVMIERRYHFKVTIQNTSYFDDGKPELWGYSCDGNINDYTIAAWLADCNCNRWIMIK